MITIADIKITEKNIILALDYLISKIATIYKCIR
jgi:hypothetical protein